MENYQNPNGQFGGWGQNGMPYGNNNQPTYVPYGSEQYKEKENDKKSLKQMGSRFGIAIILYVALSFAISFLIMVLSEYFPVFNLLYEKELANYAYVTIGSILYIGVVFSLVYIALKRKKLAGVLPFGTTYNRKAATYLTMATIPVMLLSSTIVNAISLFIQVLIGIEFTSGLEDLTMTGGSGFLMGTISMAIIPAIIEEFAIRGVVMQPLRRYGDIFAIVASSFVFSIMHGNMAQIPYTVIGGIYLGYLTIATGSIWPSIIVHFVNNMYSVVLLAVSTAFGESAAGVAGAIIIGSLIVIGVIGGIKFSSMNYKTKLEKGVETLKTGGKISALFGNIPMIIAIIVMVVITFSSIKR